MNIIKNISDKFKNILISAGLFFLYLFGTCVITMLVEALFCFFLGKIILIPYLALTILRMAIYTLGVTGLMAFVGYREGYREMEFSMGEMSAGYGMAAVLHLLFAMLFKFQGFVSGSVRFTAGLIWNGVDITSDNLLNETPYWLFLVVFLGYALLYFAAFAIAKYFGMQKRIIDRGELRRNEQM